MRRSLVDNRLRGSDAISCTTVTDIETDGRTQYSVGRNRTYTGWVKKVSC